MHGSVKVHSQSPRARFRSRHRHYQGGGFGNLKLKVNSPTLRIMAILQKARSYIRAGEIRTVGKDFVDVVVEVTR